MVFGRAKLKSYRVCRAKIKHVLLLEDLKHLDVFVIGKYILSKYSPVPNKHIYLYVYCFLQIWLTLYAELRSIRF